MDEYFDIDPCGNDPTSTQQVTCEANGVPGGAYVQADDGFPVFMAATADLEPETGHSFGGGLIYTPVWARGLSASVDYFQVELSDYIWPGVAARSAVRVRGTWHRERCETIRRLSGRQDLAVDDLYRQLRGAGQSVASTLRSIGRQ